MEWQIAVYTLPSVVIAGVAAVLFAYLLFKRDRPGVTYLLVLTGAVALWTTFNACEQLTPGMGLRIVWAKIQYFSITTIPVAWLGFALHQTGRKQWLTPRVFGALGVVPALILVMVWTNGFHGLVWSRTDLDTSSVPPIVVWEHGAAFFIHVAYAYTLVLLGTVLLIASFPRGFRVYRRQALVLLIAAVAPLLANAGYVFDLEFLPAKDLTPLSFVISLVLLTWSLFHLRLLDIAPLAYETVFQGIGDGVIVADTEGCVLIANATAAQQLEAGAAGLAGSPVHQLIPELPDLSPSPGGVIHLETSTESAQGRRFFDVRVWPLRHGVHSTIGHVIILHDTTKRKRSERALRESEERFRNLAENVPGVIYLCRNDARWTMLYLNDAVEPLTGYPKEEFLADRLSFVDLYHPDDTDEIYAEVDRALEEQQPFRLLYRIKHKDGSWRWIEELGIGIYRDDELLMLEGFLSDWTARKEIEDALRFTQFAVEHCADAAFWMDANGRFIYVNQAACAMLGYTYEEFLSMTICDIDPDHSTGTWKEGWSRLKHSGSLKGESRHVAKDGRTIPVEVSANFVRFQDGEYNCAFSRDISQRKRIEDERFSLERQVLHAQKMESLGVLAGGIAHDFNNILVAILGYAELALGDVGPNHPAREKLHNVTTGAKRAAELTQQMLAYSGRGQFSVRPSDLSSIAEDVIHLLRTSISKKISLKIQLQHPLPKIVADASQIQQVVMNLVTNAAEAIGDAVGCVSISTGTMDCTADYLATSLTADVPVPGHYIYLEVTDTGNGMDEETRARIFEPFFTTKFTGRGLGLAAALGIVRGHNGAVQLRSEPGKGTTFRVLFPASGIDSAPAPEEANSGNVGWQGSGTVLVVDDEDVIRSFATDVLEMHGFDVATACDGYEGVQRFREHDGEFACVLLDLTMPRMGGEEAFVELRKIRDDIPIVLSSGYNEEEGAKQLVDLPPAAFIRKPYTVQQLTDTMRDILEGPSRANGEDT
ncbi:MAG: PAS domain S-box protein [bacterium]|nr:PAS domain S-box protein [bacterium]